MKYSEIRRLVKLVESSDIDELEIEVEGGRVRIHKQPPASNNGTVNSNLTATMAREMPAPVEMPAVAAAPPAIKTKYFEVRSPMVGTFYRAAAPEAPPYVQIGDRVDASQVLCIIEAMKLMNEIESDVAGRIISIAVENAEPVEFGQVLFEIDPE